MQPLFLFKLAGIPFFSFTTLVVGGMAAGILAGMPAWRRAGRSPQDAVELAAWMTFPALCCGRIVHIATNLDYFVERPAQMVWFADGGLGLVGVSGGAVLGLWLWGRRRGECVAELLDLAVLPTLTLATMAWVGAFLHGSQYGAPSDSNIALELRDNYGVVLARWPTQLWAAGWAALCALASIIARGAERRAGSVAAFALSMYSAGMLFIDASRGDPSIYIWGLRMTQSLYVVVLGCGIVNLGRICRRS
ncbi:MAG: prolipoprotein diacylglyceryl transferase [Chloroflexi bacterium]|nr:prolipoprotein diacylglyceryl transferase [Chloroflexota bacterium]